MHKSVYGVDTIYIKRMEILYIQLICICIINWKLGKWVDGIRIESTFPHVLYFEILNLLLCERHFREEWSCLLTGSWNSLSWSLSVKNKMQENRVSIQILLQFVIICSKWFLLLLHFCVDIVKKFKPPPSSSIDILVRAYLINKRHLKATKC